MVHAATPPAKCRTRPGPVGDPRRRWIDALDEADRLGRAAHVAAVDIATGGGSADALEAARQDLADAIGEVDVARDAAGAMLLAMLRAVRGNESQRRSLVVFLAGLVEPEVLPLVTRLASLEARVADLETALAEVLRG